MGFHLNSPNYSVCIFAFTIAGKLFTWGRDQGDGRLGLGSGGGPGEAGSFSIPSKVNALPVPVTAVSCGGFFTMALTSDGQIWSWGGKDFIVNNYLIRMT